LMMPGRADVTGGQERPDLGSLQEYCLSLARV
jgi:hypothetical protein